ncbi:metal ABC transporter ATP-binding protein [Sciscionella sediminilitoris]|uniref:metal ABC transporter ATP-binding protein n=1 Tax=Sciscionella sediminilitoris TaxID=1445613 RepID=UPI00068BAAE6|nr:ATP-binding cassette domain-containing protein [Sciscionella sp. SE31]
MTAAREVGVAQGIPSGEPSAIELRDAGLGFGKRTLWEGLNLSVAQGEFLVVLGPNGSGKTSLLRVLLGLQGLTGGSVAVAGEAAGAGNRRVGYVPQQKTLGGSYSVRGRDLVGLGLDGHRWGIGLRARKQRREKVEAALAAVGASEYADRPIGALSGGEQQRLRVAQALVGEPDVLLCDEPLLSLDLAHQHSVSELIGTAARESGAAVVFVTHEINPVLKFADRILYLVDGRFRIGAPAEVMTTETLTELYRSPVEVVRVREKLVVVGADEAGCHHAEEGED